MDLGTTCASPDQCDSRFCTDGVCCDQEICTPGELCNIFELKGQCFPPGYEGDPCENNTDCNSLLNCQFDPFQGFSVCAIPVLTPTFGPTNTPTVGPAPSCRYVVPQKAVFVIDTATNAILQTVLVSDARILLYNCLVFCSEAARRQELVVDDARKRLYVPNRGECFDPGRSPTVVVLDTQTNSVAAAVPVGDIENMVINVSGTRLYVTGEGGVLVLDSTRNLVFDQFPVGPSPQGIAINPTGSRVYVANGSSGQGPATVSVVDAAQDAVVATVLGSFLSLLPDGSSGGNLAVNPAGTRLYWSDRDADLLSVIDTATNAVTVTFPASANPFASRACPESVVVSPDGTHAYIANTCEDTVSVMDTATNSVTTRVAMETTPEGLAVSPSNGTLYVANRHGVALLQSGGTTVLNTVAIAGGASSVAINQGGTRLYALGTIAGAACSGDCGNDGSITIDELVTMVNIALGNGPLSTCTGGDADSSGEITINEIVAAVNNALNGCP